MKLSLVRAPGLRTPPGALPLLVTLARRLAPSWLRVQLVLTDDAHMRRLNREFRGLDRSTDVLSFLYDSKTRRLPAHARVDAPNAELYVSLSRVRVQARERGHSQARELVFLALHGLLHLQGHDHERPADARRMRAAELPHLRWLARRAGWSGLQPRVPAHGTARG